MTEPETTYKFVEIYRLIVNSKYYHYGQYLGFFVFTYLINCVCLDRSISEWLPTMSWIISDCNTTDTTQVDVLEIGNSIHTTTIVASSSREDEIFINLIQGNVSSILRNDIPYMNVNTTQLEIELRKTSIYCYGVNTIYRSNMALAIFYLTNLLTLIYLRYGFLDYYLVRWAYFFVLGTISMILPSIFVKIYVVIAFLGSLVFLFLNVVTLIDFTSQLQQHISRRRVDNRWIWVSATLFHILSLMMDLFSIIYFSCLVARLLVLINLVMKLVVYFQYFWPYIQRKDKPTGCFLSCGTLLLYNSFILLTAMESGLGLDSYCGRGSSDNSGLFSFGLLFDSFVMVIVILWAGYSIANSHNFLRLTRSDYSENIFAVHEAINEQTNLQTHPEEGVPENEQTCNQVLYDLYRMELIFWKRLQQMRIYFMVIILATFALLTSMTSWQFYNGQPSVRVDTGLASMWAKVSTIVLAYIGFILIRHSEAN